MRRLLAALAVTLTALVALAAPAFAHAELVSTDPVAGATLPSSPPFATVTFDEAVSARADALQLHDADGRRVDTGDVARVDGGKALRVKLPALANGGYVLTWRVVSDDGHPVSGGVTWRVGSGTAVAQSELEQLLNAQGGDTTLHVVAAIVRTILFAALVVLVGGLLFVFLVWPAGGDERRVRSLLRYAAIAAAVTTVLSMGIEGADVAGFGVGKALSVGKALDTVHDAFGKAALVRLALLAVLGVLAVTMTTTRRRSLAWGTGVGLLSAMTLATLSFAGHARTGRWTSLALPLDVVHLLAAALWLGGLGILTLLVLPRGDADEAIVERFSRLAAVCVATVVVTGTVQGYRQLRHVSAVRGTEYGRLLVIKVVLVALVVVVGALSRSLVRARRHGGEDLDQDDLRRRLRVSVGIEAVIGVGVLVATSLLVAANPSTALASEGFSAARVVQGTVIEAAATPTRSGPVTFHLYASDPGAGLTTAFDATATLSLPARGITGVNVPLQPTGHAHWTAEGVDVPIRGTWRLEVTVTFGSGTTRTATFDLPIS